MGEPKFLTTQKVALCLCDFGLKSKLCPWPGQLRAFLYPRKNALGTLCTVTCGCISLTLKAFVEYYSVDQHCKYYGVT